MQSYISRDLKEVNGLEWEAKSSRLFRNYKLSWYNHWTKAIRYSDLFSSELKDMHLFLYLID